MTYGFNIYKANGSLLVGSASYGSLLLEVIQVPYNSGTYTRSYPNLAGSSIYVMSGQGGGVDYIVGGSPGTFSAIDSSGPQNGVSYSGGFPSLTIVSGNPSNVGVVGQVFVMVL